MTEMALTPRVTVAPWQRVCSPGDVLLKNYMLPRAMSRRLLARRTGIPAAYISEILKDRRRLSVNDAKRLALVLDTTALYWLVLQARYDLERESPEYQDDPPPLA